MKLYISKITYHPIDMATITTINKAVSLVRENNPGCYITRGMIENAIRNKELGYISVGCRKLVNYEQVLEYLNNACRIDYKPSEKGCKGK